MEAFNKRQHGDIDAALSTLRQFFSPLPLGYVCMKFILVPPL